MSETPHGPRPEDSLSTRSLVGDPARLEQGALQALREIRNPRPIDLLVSRLEARDGDEWFEAGFGAEPLDLLDTARDALLGGSLPLETLRSLKNRAKHLHRRGNEQQDGELRLRGLCGYFLAIGAGLVHHRTLMSSLPQRELRDVLFELASALPADWSRFLERAVEVEHPSRE